ncbi:MAG: aldo/keto reductase [Clostridiales bacterium]|nr:aldo/keto reductase [Clostridiales bacterium]
MQYRDLGKTGLKISQLGFGCMRLPERKVGDDKYEIDDEVVIPMIRRAYELGVNYFDTAAGYCHGNSEAAVGRAVKPFRDKILLSTKLPLWEVKETADFRRILDRALRRMDCGHIDVYHFHAINKRVFDEKIIGFGLLDEARKAMDEGLIRHLAFSFHDDPDNMAYIIERGEIFASVLMQYNLLDRSNEEALANAHAKGLGTIIMGPVGGGRLAEPSPLSERLGERDQATYELALRFVLGNPNVSCALSGMTSTDIVEKNARVAADKIQMTAEDQRAVAERFEKLKALSDLYCTGCEYCMPCPKGINIPQVFTAHTYKNVYGMPVHARNIWNTFGEGRKEGAHPSVCVSCGACAKKCPQKIDIPAKLKELCAEFAK